MTKCLPLLAALAAVPLAAWAVQPAPGVDPLPLATIKRPGVDGPHLGAPKAQPGITGREGVIGRPGQQARLARFEAKVITIGPNSIESTEEARQVVSMAADGVTKVCTMDIGSATTGADGFNRYGPQNNTAQPVVIRGAVINICR